MAWPAFRLVLLFALLPAFHSFEVSFACARARDIPKGSSIARVALKPRVQAAWQPRGVSPSQRHAAGDDMLSLPEDSVVEAVGRAGSRVTVADVAAAGGIDLEVARKGLVKLAAALGAEASLEVSQSGELVYNFPSDARAALAKASSAAALREAWNNAKPALFTGLRVAFGVALFASIAVIYTALIVLSSSGSSDRDRGRRDDGGGFGSESFGGGGFGGGGFGFGPTLWYGPSPFDLFFYRPYYTYGGYDDYEEEARPKMGFLEAVYSLVFGDGDPNAEREQKVLAAVAATARRNSGVLTAEQLAPLLDPPEYRSAKDAINVDERWVLKTLTRLNGRPEVTVDGQIVYIFDDLQTTAAGGSQRKPEAIIKEATVPFSLADDGQLFFAGLLGALNLIGAGYLGLKLATLPAGIALPGFLGLVQSIYPALLAYAVGFIAAPVLRYLSLGGINAAIEERNERRQQWLGALRSGAADGKLAQARTFRTATRQVGAGDTVYSTAKGAAAQGTANDIADFDRRLGKA
eukprot:CAMPEP_0171136834 /NCGR_PEP_ID=MMETSP0766_2-20121228/132242_1 /TAXON_ID=439317 /ORGANISM="Gambierdiscus australes, Strain CAWD 149" /LENGTH=520 /DNA_ID=CAMNT_0011600389 /DNA_START=13 /DNA_END=1575 /DNA_ORIENTATION=+